MINKISCSLFGVALFLCVAVLYSCTSDIGTPEDALKRIGEEEAAKAGELSSSDGGGGEPSSSGGVVEISSSSGGEEISSSSLEPCEGEDDCEEPSSSSDGDGESSSSSDEGSSSSSSDEGSSSSSDEGSSSSSDEGSSSSSSSSSVETFMCGDKEYNPETEKCEGGWAIGKNTNYCSGTIPSGSFCDKRDDKRYKQVTINGKIWMAENLNFDYNNTLGSCYGNTSANCVTYGRLYNWAAAKTVCPGDWHLPSNAEWTALVTFAGDSAGTKLRAKRLWEFDDCDQCQWNNNESTDKYNFSALPGGYKETDFVGITKDGIWWTSTEQGNDALTWWTHHWTHLINSSQRSKTNLHSVRCIKD